MEHNREKKHWQDRASTAEKRGDEYKADLYAAKNTLKKEKESYERSRNYFKNLIEHKNEEIEQKSRRINELEKSNTSNGRNSYYMELASALRTPHNAQCTHRPHSTSPPL